MKIGMTEILLILVIALFVIGPDKLPEFTRKLGMGLKQFRKFSSEATKEIRENVIDPLEEAQKPLREAMEPVAELGKEVSEDVNGIKKSFTDLSKPMKITPSKKTSEGDVTSAGESADKMSAVEKDAGLSAKEPETVPADSSSGRTDRESAKSAAEEFEQASTGDMPDEPGQMHTDDIAQEVKLGGI